MTATCAGRTKGLGGVRGSGRDPKIFCESFDFLVYIRRLTIAFIYESGIRPSARRSDRWQRGHKGEGMLEAEGRRTRESQGGAAGRQEYWLQLYARYHGEVRRFFVRRVECAQDAEDLVQEVFASLILHDYRPQHPRAYLHTMARHHWCTYRKCRCRARRAEHQAAVLRQWEAVGTACHAPQVDPLERLLGWEMEVLVHTILMGLAPVLGEVLRLRFLDELEIVEAAVRAGCSRDGLQRRLRRATRSFVDRWEVAYGGSSSRAGVTPLGHEAGRPLGRSSGHANEKKL